MNDPRMVDIIELVSEPDVPLARARLERYLDAAEADVRFAAALVLVQIDRTTADGRAGEVLRAAATSPESIHPGLLWALQSGGDVLEVVEPLYVALAISPLPLDPGLAETRAHSRRLALEALGRVLPARRAAVADALRPALRDGDADTRVAVADLLRQYGPVAAAAAPELRANLVATDVTVRGASAVALWRIEGRNDPSLAQVVSDLLATLPARARGRAVDWIEQMGGAPRGAAAFLMAAANDADSEVAFTAAAVLTQPGLLSAAELEQVVEALPGSLPMLPTLLARLGEPAWPALVRGLGHDDPGVRAAYTAVLGEAGVPAARVVPLLSARLDQERERFARAGLAGALARYGAEAAAARPVLIEMLASDDGVEANAAASALRAIGGPVPVDGIVARLRSPAPFQRWLAAELLRTLETRDPAAGQALLAALADPDPHTRAAVATALSFIDAANYPQTLPVIEAALSNDQVAYQPGDPLVQGLMRHGAAAVPILARHAAPGGTQRTAALSALAAMPVGTPGVADALKALAASGEMGGRSSALMAITTGHLTREEAMGDVAAALRSADPSVRLSGVMGAMAGMPAPDVMRQLAAIASDRQDPLWPYALMVVAPRDPAFARAHVDDLVRLLTHEPWIAALRSTGVGAMSGDFTTGPALILGGLGPDASAALPALNALAADRQPQTAAAARLAVARIEGRAVRDLVESAVADLSAPNELTRGEALLTLTYLGTDAAAALPALERLPAQGQTTDWLLKAAIASIRGQDGPR